MKIHSGSPSVNRLDPIISVNTQHHCAVCDADHSCGYTVSGMHHCHHRKGEWVPGWICVGVSAIGFGMYRREGDEDGNYLRAACRRAKPQRSARNPGGAAKQLDEDEAPDTRLKDWLATETKALRRLDRRSPRR